MFRFHSRLQTSKTNKSMPRLIQSGKLGIPLPTMTFIGTLTFVTIGGYGIYSTYKQEQKSESESEPEPESKLIQNP